MEKVLPPRRQRKLLPAISKDQLDILVGNAITDRDKVTLNLFWYSGMRLSEAANVKDSDFNWEEGTVIVLGKGNRYRKALAANGMVKDWFMKHDSLGIAADGISTMLKRLGKATGIECDPHSFRRGSAVHQVNRDYPTRLSRLLVVGKVLAWLATMQQA
jgi:site-specific recombinase XerC